MHKIELLAGVWIARGCGFAALAIVTLMLGLSRDMALASEGWRHPWIWDMPDPGVQGAKGSHPAGW